MKNNNPKLTGFTPTPKFGVSLQGKRGFTLIELLVVISIIGFLTTAAVVMLNSARMKARDARRISDLKQIQTALELFYDQYGQYPVTGGHQYWDGHWQLFSACLETGAVCGIATPGFKSLISKVPQDPLDDPATLSDSDPTYYYAWPAGCSNGQSYRLAAYLETNNAVLQNDLDGGFYNNNGGCDDLYKGYCIGAGSCSGW
ncbi:MAG: type II secretion system protein [bacterium]|nr:type II secretion system protein [bacterium]